MARNEAEVRFKAETTQFNSSIKKMNEEAKKLRQEFKLQTEQMKLSATDTEKLRAKLDSLQKQYDVAKQKTQATNEQLQKAKAIYGENSTEVAKLERQLRSNQIAEQQLANSIAETSSKLSEAEQADRDRNSEAARSAQRLEELKKQEEKLQSSTEKLNAEFELQEAQLGVNASETDKLKLKIEHLGKQHQLAQEQVRNYEEQLEHAKRQYGENSTEANRYEAQLLEARAAEQRLANEIRTANGELIEQSNQFTRASEAAQKLGGKLTDVGKSMTMKVTAPIVALGAGALKVGMDFEASMSNVQAISGATGNDLMALEGKARELGASTSKSASEAADALGYMALAGWDTKQMMGGLEPILRLSEAGALDLGRASDLVTDSMAAMQLTVQDLPGYLDMVAQASRKSNTDIDALMEAFLVAGGTLASFNVPVEESTALLGSLANRGYKGAQAGTAMNAIFTNLTSGLGASGKAMKELGLSAFDSEGNFKGLEVVLLEVKEKLSGMTEEQQAQYISMIAGKEHLKTFQALMAGLGDEYGQLKADVINSEGALTDMAKTMQDNAKGKMTELKSALEEVGIAFSNHIIPFVTKATQSVTKLVTWFGNLDEGTQKTIIKVLGLAAAIGPLLIIAGKLISAFGIVAGAVGTVSSAIAVVTTGVAAATPAVGALASVFTVLTGPVGLAIAAIGGLTIGTVALVKHLSKDVIPEVDRFGEGVSDATKEALGGYFELSDGASLALKEMTMSQKRMTDEMATTLIDSYSQMNDQILEKMEERHTQQLENTRNYLANSNVLSDDEEKQILANLDKKNKAEQINQTMHGERINEIIQTAADEKRRLTEQEQQEINNIQQQMNENAVKYLSENEVESKMILEKMKQQAGDFTARQAAEVVANSNKQKNEAVKAAEEQYEESIAEIIRMRDEAGVITADQAERMIEEAKKQRDETVMHAEDMHNKVIEEAKKQAGEHIDHVDWETGEVLSKWDVFKNDTAKTWNNIVKSTKEGWKSVTTSISENVDKAKTNTSNAWELIKKNTVKKWNETSEHVTTKATELKDNAVKRFIELRSDAEAKFLEIKKRITEPIEKAKDLISGWVDDIRSFFANLKLKFPKIEMPKLPKFKLEGSFSLKPPSVPKISVDWFAKGGLMLNPTLFGRNGNTLMAGGEASPEAILPLTDTVLGKIGEMMAAATARKQGLADSLANTISNNVFHFTLISELDGQEVARNQYTYMDGMFANSASNNAYVKGVR